MRWCPVPSGEVQVKGTPTCIALVDGRHRSCCSKNCRSMGVPVLLAKPGPSTVWWSQAPGDAFASMSTKTAWSWLQVCKSLEDSSHQVLRKCSAIHYHYEVHGLQKSRLAKAHVEQRPRCVWDHKLLKRLWPRTLRQCFVWDGNIINEVMSSSIWWGPSKRNACMHSTGGWQAQVMLLQKLSKHGGACTACKARSKYGMMIASTRRCVRIDEHKNGMILVAGL